MKRLNVAILFECSGRTREAFRALGHNAHSWDLKPAEDGSRYHNQEDVENFLNGAPHTWDLVIAHPTCTYLANSGVRWLTTVPKKPKSGVLYGEARRRAMVSGALLFRRLLDMRVPFAIENPVMHKHAVVIVGRKHDQTVQPYHFGDPFKKRTCFWLNGLPQLFKTSDMQASEAKQECWLESPGPNRQTNRSRTYPGLAKAMADQWSRFIDASTK
jgi:hypothetical protein